MVAQVNDNRERHSGPMREPVQNYKPIPFTRYTFGWNPLRIF